MNDKIELLKYAVERISENKDYMGFYLKHYCTLENITDPELILKLNSNYENYLKLGLCIVPSLSENSFVDRINVISEYTHISALDIIRIIRHVAAIQHFSGMPSASILMAARDKQKPKNEDDK